MLPGLNLFAQGRLREVQPSGRPGEVELLGDRQEIAQIAQVRIHTEQS
jgi:hypothetical protein